jgi:hypothetical protein
MKVTESTDHDYFAVRGIRSTAPEALNEALRVVLDAMPTLLYGDPTDELTADEQAVLKEGGVNLAASPTRDPLAETAVQYAAIIESSLSTKEAAARLGMPQSQVRQMMARRTLYSILLNNRRYIPIFQFEKNGKLVDNITKVNAALPTDLHPVEVYEWYSEPDAELFVGDDIDATMSPLTWLRNGFDVKRLVSLARHQ